jgi:hypothetical protein
MSAEQELTISIVASDEFSSAFEDLGVESQQASEDITQVTEASGLSAQQMAHLGSQMAGVTAGGVMLSDSFLRVQDAQLRLQNAQDNLTKATDAYNAAVAKYGPNSQQAQSALLSLQNAQDNVTVATNRAQMAHEQQMMAIVSFIPQLATLATSEQVVTAAQWLWNTALDANPIGAVVLAVTLLVGAIAYLTDGFRNFHPIINAVTEAFKVMDEAATWLYNHSIGPIIKALEEIANNPVAKTLMAGATALGNAIAHLQSGGIVTQPTVAMIGEAGPEAVIPLSRGAAASGVSAGGGGTVQQNNVIHFNVENIDSRSDYDWQQTIQKNLLKVAANINPAF